MPEVAHPGERRVGDRIVMLVDLDSFYASVEEARRPELKGKPVVVCVYSGRTEASGAVATASYRARALGIRAGMPIPLAMKLARGSDAVFLPVDREYYAEVSERVMEILAEEADALEQVSIDEAYMEVTHRAKGDWGEAVKIASRIKERVREEEGITCSIGIGPNKFVAKMAAGQQKPDGLTIVRKGEVETFLAPMLVEELHGIGPKTAGVLRSLGVMTTADLARKDVQELVALFGEAKGLRLHEIARGIDLSPVERRERTQLSRIGTLKQDTGSAEAIAAKLGELAAELDRKIGEEGIGFRTVSVVLIASDLRTFTRSESLPVSHAVSTLLPLLRRLVQEWLAEHEGAAIRRVGVRVSHLTRERGQRTLGEYG